MKASENITWKSKESIAAGVLCTGMLLFSSQTLDPSLTIRFSYAWAAIFLVSLLFAFRKQHPQGISLGSLFLAGLAVWGVYGYMISPVPADGLFVMLKLLLLAGLVILFPFLDMDLSRFWKFLSRYAMLLVALSVAVATAQLTKLLGQGPLDHQALYAIKSIHGNKNVFAEILVLLFPFAMYASIKERGMWRWLSFAVIVASLAFVLFLVSRTVWIALFLSFVCGAVLILFVKNKTDGRLPVPKFLVWGIPSVVVLGIGAAAALGYGDILYQQAHNFINVKYGSALDRLFLWDKSFKVIGDGWITGNGLESWKIEMLSAGVEGLKSQDELTFYQRPHNDFIWVLFEQGLVGLLLYLSAFAVAGLGILKAVKQSQYRFEYICSMMILVAFGAISLFAFPKERIEHLLIIGIVFSVGFMASGFKPLLLKSGKFVFIILIAVALLGVYVGVSRFTSEKELKVALMYRSVGNWMQTAVHAENAKSDLFMLDLVSTPVDWYIGESYYFMNNINRAYKYFAHAYELNPYHIHNTNNLGTCYAKMGQPEKALALYKEALEINPSFTESLYNISSLYYNMKQYEKGAKYLQHIPDSINPQRYKKVVGAYVPALLRRFFDESESGEVKNVINGILNDPQWAFQLYSKAVENNISFKQQLYLDVAYILCDERGQITEERKKEIENMGLVLDN